MNEELRTMTNGQSERIPADRVIRDLKTTSDKIRKLAAGGYLRTEISKLLGIRYQHVRRVLVDAGITDGLKRPTVVNRPPAPFGPTSPSPQVTRPEALLQKGFRHLARWTLTNSGALALDAPSPVEPAVYVFVLDNVLVYVGLASRGLQRRMNAYRRGHKRQKTSARIHRLIKESLENGRKVEVLMATPEDVEWNGLPVSTAAGLEWGLIRMNQPEWNIQGASRRSRP